MSKGLKFLVPSTPLLETTLVMIDQKVLVDMYEIVKDKSPHTRTFIHTLRAALGATKSGELLNLDLDQEKSLDSAVAEDKAVYTSQENGFMKDAQEKLNRLLRRAFGDCKENGFESVILEAALNLVDIFWTHEEPLAFHEKKFGWLVNVNAQLAKFVVEGKKKEKHAQALA